MAAEGALLVSSNLGSCAIDPTFTAQVEQRVVKEVLEIKLDYNTPSCTASRLASAQFEFCTVNQFRSTAP